MSQAAPAPGRDGLRAAGAPGGCAPAGAVALQWRYLHCSDSTRLEEISFSFKCEYVAVGARGVCRVAWVCTHPRCAAFEPRAPRAARRSAGHVGQAFRAGCQAGGTAAGLDWPYKGGVGCCQGHPPFLFLAAPLGRAGRCFSAACASGSRGRKLLINTAGLSGEK